MELDKNAKPFLDLCLRFGQDPKLAAALVTIESAWNPWAIRYEPLFSWVSSAEKWASVQGWSEATERTAQKTSWGLMQVMGGTARSIGYRDHLTKLLLPEIGLEWGLRYLATKTSRYAKVEDAISAYNSGSARKDADGQYENAGYVAKVVGVMRA